uniref:Microtubule associated scaffold protein 2 n=1 Tax=Gouania willdenowi TaxID=441366 RepID=A0A8C5DH20_GOUWI
MVTLMLNKWLCFVLFFFQNKTAEENQGKLILEMTKIQEEMAFHLVRWDRIQREKSALEVAFEQELQELQLQQEAELAAVEESIRKCHSAETEHLKTEHRSEMEELRAQQQEQVGTPIDLNHKAAVQELRDMHNITMATLHEEHQKILLEEDFDKLRLSLQDALAPYQHIEEDLKSLKEVVEMKNQQIHQQEKKITDLEKVAQKNVFLEEKVQVLQQQNEDLRARIQLNLTLQLSEENANLHDSVEKERTEKKRLSRNNEELLWRSTDQSSDVPSSSPLHRSFSSSPVHSSSLL